MTNTERYAAEWEEYLQADTDEERKRIQSGWAGQTTKADPFGWDEFEREHRPALTIPASVERQLRAIVGPEGIEPRLALARLAEAGHHYERTGKRITGLKRRARVVSTGRGRGSRWVLLNK